MTAARTASSRRLKGKRTEIEADLVDTYSVDYQYLTKVPASEFDIDTSLANQARFEALDEGTVEIYKEAVERGDAFPAVIAWRPGRGANPKLVIIDGNHRLVAHERAGVPLDVYEIDRSTNAQTVGLMTVAFNTKHGRPTSEPERLHSAIWLINNGASQDAAAAALNVPIKDLRRELAKEKGNARAKEVGLDIREWESLLQGNRNRLMTVATDEGYHGAAHLAYAARLGSEEVAELVALLNTSKSAGKQRAIIRSETAKYGDRIQDSGGGTFTSKTRSGMTPKTRIHMVLGQITALPDDIEGLARTFADAERVDTARQLMNSAERITKLARALDPAVG